MCFIQSLRLLYLDDLVNHESGERPGHKALRLIKHDYHFFVQLPNKGESGSFFFFLSQELFFFSCLFLLLITHIIDLYVS